MKIVLAISLILNVVLGIFLVGKKNTPVMERTIIETHGEPRQVKMRETRAHLVSPVDEKEKKESQETLPEPMDIDQVEVQDAGERMENERAEFLHNELQIPEATLKEHQKLRNQYFQASGELWKASSTGELSFDQKRELIDMEEKLHQDLEKLYGKKNWERYQKYRENYNKRGLKKQSEDNHPFIFMGL